MSDRVTTKATLPASTCFVKSKDGEPVFLLCARDPTAPRVVRAWADERQRRLDVEASHMSPDEVGHEQGKIDGARETALSMDIWRRTGGACS